jgi:hypothetical protein
VTRPTPPVTPDERDAWLHQALRHAPDAGATPPNALRDAILAEARSAVRRRPAARSSLIDAFAAFWSWLARPPVAAGFASVMAATLVGLMWWDRPMDEALPPPPLSRPAERTRPQPAPPAPTAPDTTSSSDTPLPAQTAAAPTDKATGPALPATSAKTAAPRALVAEPRKDNPATSNSLQAVPAATPFPDKSESGGRTSAQNLSAATAMAKKSEPAPATTSSATTAAVDAQGAVVATQVPRSVPAETARRADAVTNDAKSADALAAAPRPEALAAKPESALRQRAAAPTRDAAGALDAGAGAAAAPRAFAAAPTPAREQEAAPDARRATVNSTAEPMAALLSSIAQDATRWSRSMVSGDAAPLDAPMQAWLASVDAATAGHWRTQLDGTTRLDATTNTDPRALLLRRDGQAAATIRIEDGGVLFAPRPGPTWFAPLSADAVARLRATLPVSGR